ncbi:MarR family transcriptional regulator [Promicromonospora sp. NPDC050262]|uniref:MarR family winged helix-turn-helix transcriptional regulator n=1 Tax=Promicromonospora sp. NPDC050262 TaxID=3155036 RepID=UPI0034048214
MPEKPPFSPTIALLTIGRVWDAAFADALKPLGLTTRKYGLLGHIRATPGVSFSELARRSRITVQSAHTAVAAFAADGLVEDTTARAGAASRLRVTAAGERLLSQAAERVAVLDARFAEEYPVLTEALRRQIEEHMARSR